MVTTAPILPELAVIPTINAVIARTRLSSMKGGWQDRIEAQLVVLGPMSVV